MGDRRTRLPTEQEIAEINSRHLISTPIRPADLLFVFGTREDVGRRVEEISLPKGTTIGAIVRQLGQPAAERSDDRAAVERDVQVIIAHHDTVIEPDDHVIVFVVNKRMVAKVEKLFQVGIGFL